MLLLRALPNLETTPANEVAWGGVFFAPGFAEEIFAGMGSSLGSMLGNGPEYRVRTIELGESLRPHDGRVSPLLRAIATDIERPGAARRLMRIVV